MFSGKEFGGGYCHFDSTLAGLFSNPPNSEELPGTMIATPCVNYTPLGRYKETIISYQYLSVLLLRYLLLINFLQAHSRPPSFLLLSQHLSLLILFASRTLFFVSASLLIRVFFLQCLSGHSAVREAGSSQAQSKNFSLTMA